MADRAPQIMHASAVAFGNAGLLITGASGAGKSTLALQLLAIGARLIADDRVMVVPLTEGGLRLSAPDPISGMIEARGMGVLRAESVVAIARAVVDLNTVEKERMPNPKEIVIAGEPLTLFSKVESPAFPAMLRLTIAGH